MPLAERRRAVPVVPQDPRQRRAIARKHRRVPREPARELTDRAETDRVVVPPGQQRRPRRRAQRRDMEPVVPQPALSHPRVVRGGYRPTEGGRVAEPGIVDQHQQHIRRPRRRLDVPDQVPVRAPTPPASCCPPPQTAACGSAASYGQAHSSFPTSRSAPTGAAILPVCRRSGLLPRSSLRASRVVFMPGTPMPGASPQRDRRPAPGLADRVAVLRFARLRSSSRRRRPR